MHDSNRAIGCGHSARLAALVAAALVAAASAIAADPVTVPGGALSMEPPAGFELSDDFSGFESPDTGSSILIAEMPPEARREIATLFATLDTASDLLSPQGVTVREIVPVTVDGDPVNLVVGEQRAGDLVIDKYFAVLGDDAAVLVTINAVGGGDPDRDEAIRALESITLAAPPTLAESVALLPFGFEPAAPFQTRRVMAGSGVALTTFEGDDPGGGMPMIVIAGALADLDVGDLQAASERLMAGTVGFELAKIGPGERIVSGRALAWRVEADAGDRLAIHYLWPLPRGRYLRLIAMGETERLASLREVVAEIAASVVPRAVASR